MVVRACAASHSGLRQRPLDEDRPGARLLPPLLRRLRKDDASDHPDQEHHFGHHHVVHPTLRYG